MTNYDPFEIDYALLGRILAERRARDGLSLRALAKVLNMSPATLCRIEGGKWLNLKADHFLIVIEYLGGDVMLMLPAGVCVRDAA